MKRAQIAVRVLLSVLLFSIPVSLTMGVQQPTYPVSFSLNPSVLSVNSNVSTLACVSVSGPSNSIQINTNDKMAFLFDPSVGTVSLPPSPTVVLTSAAASPNVPPMATSADFSVALGTTNSSKLVITYNSTPKNLVYGTSICTQVNIATAAAAGTGLVRFSSQLSTVSGNLPSINVSLVSFPTSAESVVFMSNILFPSVGSIFTPLNALGDVNGNNTGAGNADGFVGGAAPMPTACTFDSLRVSATTTGVSFPYTFTLWKNDAATSMTCNLTTDPGTNTVTCSDTTDKVSVVEGDLVAVQVVQPGFTCCSPFGNIGIALHCK